MSDTPVPVLPFRPALLLPRPYRAGTPSPPAPALVRLQRLRLSRVPVPCIGQPLEPHEAHPPLRLPRKAHTSRRPTAATTAAPMIQTTMSCHVGCIAHTKNCTIR